MSPAPPTASFSLSQAALHGIDGQESLRQAQHHLHPLAPRGHYRVRSTAACPATTAASVVAAASRHQIFSSSQVLLPPRLKTGKLTLITGAMAREILVNREGKAEGVSYVDKATRTEKRISARASSWPQRLRIRASAADSKSLAFSGRHRQLFRNRRQISHRLRRQQWFWLLPATGEDAAAQSRRRRRNAHVHAVVEVRPQK